MNRRDMIKSLFGLAAAGITPLAEAAGDVGEFPPVTRGVDDWKAVLPSDRFAVLFRESTERAGSSPLNHEKRDGHYICAACYLPLFASSMKFDSGTGWPSFFDTIPGRVATKVDRKLFYSRTEYHCARCGGHQGHVFPDGPKPTGLRYCNNGLALEFVPAEQPLPELRS